MSPIRWTCSLPPRRHPRPPRSTPRWTRSASVSEASRCGGAALCPRPPTPRKPTKICPRRRPAGAGFATRRHVRNAGSSAPKTRVILLVVFRRAATLNAAKARRTLNIEERLPQVTNHVRLFLRTQREAVLDHPRPALPVPLGTTRGGIGAPGVRHQRGWRLHPAHGRGRHGQDHGGALAAR